jgi:N utilization substance protein A
MTEQAAEKKSESETAQLVQSFKEQLDVDEEVAAILVQAGFSTIEEVAYVPAAELAAIEEFDEDIVKELRNRARDVLLTQAIATEEKASDAEPAADLLEVDGMDDELAATLASHGIVTREDLAEQAIDDLTEIDGIDSERAGELIMAARKHWFEASGAAK